MSKIKTLFLDVGNVLLTNGWDHAERLKAAQQFDFDYADFEQRHSVIIPLLETDQITLDDYLTRAIFWKDRSFTISQFKEFMFAQSQPHNDMIALMKSVKQEYQLRVAILSNEQRELTEYRVSTFHLDEFVDDYFVSCYVYFQKPDPHIYKIALDVSRTLRHEAVFIDDRPNNIEGARKAGIHGILHTSYETTKQELLTLLNS